MEENAYEDGEGRSPILLCSTVDASKRAHRVTNQVVLVFARPESAGAQLDRATDKFESLLHTAFHVQLCTPM